MGDRGDYQRGTRVYVGGLSHSTKKEDLETEFEKFGKLNNVWVAFNPPGFAFIEFSNKTDAEHACDYMNGVELMGGKLRVELSRSRRMGGFRGSGGRGRGGSRGIGGGPGGSGRFPARGRGNFHFGGSGGGRGGSGGGSRGGFSRMSREFTRGGRSRDSFGGSGASYGGHSYGGASQGYSGGRNGYSGGSGGSSRYRSRSPAGNRGRRY